MSYSDRKSSKTSYVSVVVSISLVLLMLGILGSFLLKAKELSDYVKENIALTIYINDETKNIDIRKLQKQLDAAEYVKLTEFIDKKNAAEILKEDLGEDFIDFLGHNPLLSSIDVYLNADFISTNSIEKIEKEILENKIVREVYYQKDLITAINKNIRNISLVLLAFSGLLLIISTALINNTIRLVIYSKRFIIKSMQLVGATQTFIKKPFIIQGILRGVMSAIIANLFLFIAWYFLQREFPEIFAIQDIILYMYLFGIVVFLGIIISWLSTLFAVNKYLSFKNKNVY